MSPDKNELELQWSRIFASHLRRSRELLATYEQDTGQRRPEAQHNPTLAQVVDALEDDYDSSFDRLRDIVDEHFGLQPVMPQGDLMTFLEQKLAEQRRSDAKNGGDE